MKVLIACEYSGRVRDGFIKKGHDAISCDLLDSESNFGPHFKGDVFDILPTQKWDLLIAFPPCTYLCGSGLFWNKTRPERAKLTEDALIFVQKLMDANVKRIAIENPIGCISTRIRKPDQIVQPWMFGHGEQKSTCLWLKGLPKLKPTNIVDGREQKVWRMGESKNRAKLRSLTYQGIADAMAAQWGDVL
jgi:hypothetical protein